MTLPCVGDVSGLGVFLGMEIVTDKNTKAIPSMDMQLEMIKKFLVAGLYLCVLGIPWGRLGIAPAASITIEEAD